MLLEWPQSARTEMASASEYMASKITRALQKIFGGSLTPTGNIEQFGSYVNGGSVYTNDPVVIQALAAFLAGWGAATTGNSSPAIQDRNALDFLFSRQLAYLLQQGIPEWDSTTPYFTNSFCQVSGVVYVSLTDNNLGNNPPTDTNDWQPYSQTITPPGYNLALSPRAWCQFDGTQIGGTGGGSLTFTGVGISAVNKIAGQVAQYQIVFSTPFADTNYAPFVMSGSTADSLADFPRTSVKATNLFQFASMTVNSAQGQSRFCSASFFHA